MNTSSLVPGETRVKVVAKDSVKFGRFGCFIERDDRYRNGFPLVVRLDRDTSYHFSENELELA